MVTGYGLLTVEKNEHRQMRRMMNPAFSLPNLSSRVKESLPVVTLGAVGVLGSEPTLSSSLSPEEDEDKASGEGFLRQKKQRHS